MEKQSELISLFDYLGHAAGSELGKKVATAAVQQKEQIGKREITNTRFKGEVLLYRPQFLKEYFELQQQLATIDVKLYTPTVGDMQNYIL